MVMYNWRGLSLPISAKSVAFFLSVYFLTVLLNIIMRELAGLNTILIYQSYFFESKIGCATDTVKIFNAFLLTMLAHRCAHMVIKLTVSWRCFFNPTRQFLTFFCWW
jgi:hypothetical protein